jgi:hypothetical protein
MADNEMMTGYLAGKSDAGNGMGMGCGMWPWMMGMGAGMGFGGMGWGGYGGMIGEWIPLLFLAGIFGWGNGGWGGNGRGDCATQADLAAGFNNSAVLNKLNDITIGQANAINYNNQGFSGLNTAIMQGFHGVDNAVCNLGYNVQTGFNGISRQLSDCCCDTRAAIQGVNTGIERAGWNLSKQISDCCCDVEKMNLQNRFDAAQANCGTLQAIDKLGDRILGYLNDKEQQNLRDEVQAYRLQASQAKQNEYLINQLRPCPVPAYPACNPYAPVQGWGNAGGCGCGCAA